MEFMVEMSCEGCVKACRNKLETIDGACFITFSRVFFFIALVYLFCCVSHCSCLGLGTYGLRMLMWDFSNQVVRVLGIAPVKTVTEALEQTNRKTTLIFGSLTTTITLMCFRVDLMNLQFLLEDLMLL